MSNHRITYYAIAMTDDGKIGQLLVTRENGRHVGQEWTGVTYKTAREAEVDIARLNSVHAKTREEIRKMEEGEQ